MRERRRPRRNEGFEYRAYRFISARAQWIFPGFIVLASALGQVFAVDLEPNRDLFSATAQVFPVLLIALFVEVAAETRDWRRSSATKLTDADLSDESRQ